MFVRCEVRFCQRVLAYLSPCLGDWVVSVLCNLEPFSRSIGGCGVGNFGHVDNDWTVVSTSNCLLSASSGVVLMHLNDDFASS